MLIMKKFGFNYLYTDDSKVQAPYRERIDNSPYIDDDSAYKDIIDLIKKR
ncbi:phosphoglycerol transferase [Bifidobacterium adolescentis]|nr:phosphoglycerol transferase [Bifidobacterium adolescentis]